MVDLHSYGGPRSAPSSLSSNLTLRSQGQRRGIGASGGYKRDRRGPSPLVWPMNRGWTGGKLSFILILFSSIVIIHLSSLLEFNHQLLTYILMKGMINMIEFLLYINCNHMAWIILLLFIYPLLLFILSYLSRAFVTL